MAVQKMSFGLITLLLSLSGNIFAGEYFRDDLESGNLKKNQNGFKWAASRGDSGEVPKITSKISRSGKYSLMFTFQGSSPGGDAWSEQQFRMGKPLQEVYIKYYLYYPDGTEGLGAKYEQRENTNNKFFRMWDDDYRNINVKVGASTYADGTRSYIYPEKGWGYGTGLFDMPYKRVVIDNSMLGRWIEVYMHYKTDTGGGNGIIEISLDGRKIASVKNTNMYPKNNPSKNYFLNAYFLGYANSGFSKTTHVFMDDLVISDSPIGDTSANSNTNKNSPPLAPIATTSVKAG